MWRGRRDRRPLLFHLATRRPSCRQARVDCFSLLPGPSEFPPGARSTIKRRNRDPNENEGSLSIEFPMISVEILPGEPAPERESSRRTQVLVAAERAFARQGFHAATMQDVATEAGMSPGNLYRYFDSKDAIVAGLCECDQAKLARDFTSLAASGDIFAAIEMM